MVALKVSEFDPADPLDGTELVGLVQGGENRQTTAADVAALALEVRVQDIVSAATVTPTFADDIVKISAQAEALTLANPTGTVMDGHGLVIRIKDNGTARAIAYGTEYRAVGVTLPTTTVLSKILYLGLIYDITDDKWDVVAVAQEA